MRIKMFYSAELTQRCIEYCESEHSHHVVSNRLYDDTHAVNNGRFAIRVPQYLKDEGVSDVADSFMDHFDRTKIRVIIDEPYPHSFSCLYEAPGRSVGVFKHLDVNAKDGWEHLRINTMLQSGVSGGRPIVDNKELHTKNGDTWSLWANKSPHSALPITGNILRVSITLGFHVEPSYVPIVKDLLPGIVTYAT